MPNVHNNLSELFTGIADAIRSKTGSTDPIVADEFPTAIEAIEAGGSSVGGGDATSVLDSLIDGSITELTSNAESVRRYVAHWAESLVSVNFPKAKTVGSYSFSRCRNLREINFPELTKTNERCFQYCTALTEVTFPKLVTMSTTCLEYCTSLVTVNLPVAETLAGLSDCTKLTTVNCPVAKTVYNAAFMNCSALPRFDSATVTTINHNGFNGCNSLKVLALRNTESVCNLTVTNAFNNTPIASGTGYIYVPSALIDEYKAATNWSAHAAQFRALEDYTVDGTITGALDESKI